MADSAVKKYRAGDHITDNSGVEWVITRVWPWPQWDDLDLVNTLTGERGALRVETKEGKK